GRGRAPGGPARPLGYARPRHRRLGQRSRPDRHGPQRPHPGEQGTHLRHPAGPAPTWPGFAGHGRGLPGHGRPPRRPRRGQTAVSASDPAAKAGWEGHPPRVGFFTDTSVCIGCKACEVACKEWNNVPEDGLAWLGLSYDNTGELSANTWRHVAFIEQPEPGTHDGIRWLMSSDVCKHC